jgi:uncharacterized protein (TIGR02246 family)
MRKGLVTLAASWMLWIAPNAFPDSYAEDRSQVENLIARYLFALDWRDADAYAATFAENGVLDFAGGQLKGRKAIHDMIAGLTAREKAAAAKDPSSKPPPRKRHFVTNIVFDVAGNTAKGKAYWTQVSNATSDGKPVIAEYGHYEDELVKIQGQWLFAKRTVFNETLPNRAAKDMPY